MQGACPMAQLQQRGAKIISCFSPVSASDEPWLCCCLLFFMKFPVRQDTDPHLFHLWSICGGGWWSVGLVLVLGSCKMGLMEGFSPSGLSFVLGSRHRVAGLVRSN